MFGASSSPHRLRVGSLVIALSFSSSSIVTVRTENPVSPLAIYPWTSTLHLPLSVAPTASLLSPRHVLYPTPLLSTRVHCYVRTIAQPRALARRDSLVLATRVTHVVHACRHLRVSLFVHLTKTVSLYYSC